MRIALLGGSGNISSAIVAQALEAGHEVAVLTRGVRPQPAGARFIRCDRYDYSALGGALAEARPDLVIDMLCFTAADARGALDALPAGAHYALISTVCVYGTALSTLPAGESHPRASTTTYGKNKTAAEEVVERAARDGVAATIIRPSTTFGPDQGLLRQVGGGFWWIRRLQRGQPIVVSADGMALHQFLHVDDAARAIVPLLERRVAAEEASVEPAAFNVVGPVTTWREFHLAAMRVLGREVPLVGVPFAHLEGASIPGFELCREIFAHHGYFDDRRLRAALPSWRPQHSLESAIAAVYEALERAGRIPDEFDDRWEEQLIARWSPGREPN